MDYKIICGQGCLLRPFISVKIALRFIGAQMDMLEAGGVRISSSALALLFVALEIKICRSMTLSSANLRL